MKSITVTIHDKEDADIKRIFAIMGLKIKCGDELTITCDGADEDAAIAEIGKIFETL